MSLIFATAAPGVCDLLRASIETARVADAALERMTNGEADPAFPQKLESKVAAAKQLEAAVAAADATPPPRTHALVIGVGEYPHLQNGKLSPAAMALGLGQLTCSVIAAQAIADWLLLRHANGARPLATIELLLSPGIYTPSNEAASKLGIPHGSSIPVEQATLANIQAAFNRWFARCNHDRQIDPFGDAIGDAAFFFYSGHGLEKEVSLLLPEDFGSDENAPFARAIDVTTTHKRMGQCKADLQCWFLDACREAPIELLTSLDKPGVALKGDTGEPFLLRDAPLYQAAAEGRQAFGPAGQATYFVQQLIMCLNGLGADRKVAGNWRVTTQSLRSGLNAAIDRLPLVNGKRITCDSGSGQSNFTRAIHFAPGPVLALAKVSCQPIDAQPLADLYLQDATGVKILRDARDAKPWVIEVNAGAYRAGADFDAPRPPALGEETLVAPPDNPLTLLVS